MIICKKNFSVFMLLSVLGISFPMTLFGQSVTVFLMQKDNIEYLPSWNVNPASILLSQIIATKTRILVVADIWI